MAKFLIITLFSIPILALGAVSESVLSKGKWFKIGVVQSGIHKIDYKFLKNAGLDVDKLDPKKIQIYGNGGGMLPQKNSSFRVDDLAENAIKVFGESDGKFDGSDYILFYAQGPTRWSQQVSQGIFVHAKNIYCDSAYYFITYDQAAGKRVESKLSPTNSSSFQTVFDEHLMWEEDKFNLIKSGREWYGDNFNNTGSYTYNFDLTGYQSGTTIQIKTECGIVYGLNGGQSGSIFFQYKLNNVNIGSIGIASGEGTCASCLQKGTSRSAVFSTTSEIGNPSAVAISVSANTSQDPNGRSYLNYIALNYKKMLAINDGQTAFRTFDQQFDVNYQVSSASTTSEIWDVTTPYNTVMIGVGNGNTVEFLAEKQTLNHEFIAFTPEKISLSPSYVSKVPNQNLHGMAVPSLLIVTHYSLLNQAKQLADLRISQGISTEIVTTSQVFNEFSGGAQDVTAIRDLCRMLYLIGGFKNLLLFGSCSYDYKNRISANTNLVPCYESYNSFHSVYSYSSEDYFAFFGENEGDWEENGVVNYNMQIGVGRIPVKNATEAQNVIDKLITYSQVNSFGKWRNKSIFIADNGSNRGEGNIFLNDTEGIVGLASSKNGNLNVSKIYLDAYRDKSTPKGVETPGANEALRNGINQGALLLNYIGHGGTEGLAQEGVITKSSIEEMENIARLPFWVTATCDFSTYDDPAKEAAGVKVLTKAKGGGIGIISATRTVFSNSNAALNNSFFNAVFNRMPDGTMPTLGEVLRQTKNGSLFGVNNRSYSLIGDPSMTLNYPKYNAIATKINGKVSDTVRALSEMRIEGKITSGNDTSLVANFSGQVIFEIYDKVDTFNTFGQQYSQATKVAQRSSIFYAGKAEVKNGVFSTSFIVPKDINYQFGNGKISMYAFDEIHKVDAAGYKSDFIIGGGNPLAATDTIPPAIKLFMNDTTFKNGNLTHSNPFLLAKLFDESGINIARSGVGHEISAVIDSETSNPIILNDFYETSLNSYKNGSVNYQLSTLSEGNHTLTVKAWDTYNNSAVQKIDFIVSNTSKLTLEKLFNYPNPASEFTVFQFIHNHAGEDLVIDIEVMDRSGSLVHKISENIVQSQSTVEYRWDFNESNNIIAGSYVYRCKLRSLTHNSEALAVEKLVIIR